MAKNKDLTNNPLVQAICICSVPVVLAASWVLLAGIVSAVLTGDIHALYPQNLLNGILSVLSSHP